MKIYLGVGLVLVGFIFGVGMSGFFLGEEIVYVKNSSCVEYDGCWKSVKENGVRSDWVCVNVYEMDYERAVEVCKHEVGHEIFAEVCEKDIEDCFEVIKQLDLDEEE